jgi:hypothetical protein
MDPVDVIAAFERMALGDEELPVDDAVTGLAGIMSDMQMPEEVWVALLAACATLYRVGLERRTGAVGRKKAHREGWAVLAARIYCCGGRVVMRYLTPLLRKHSPIATPGW